MQKGNQRALLPKALTWDAPTVIAAPSPQLFDKRADAPC